MQTCGVWFGPGCILAHGVRRLVPKASMKILGNGTLTQGRSKVCAERLGRVSFCTEFSPQKFACSRA